MISIEPDAYVPGAFTVSIDGREQSQVNLARPMELFFDYVRRMGNIINIVAEPGLPITAVHLGAGGLTLPRFVQATRPGSRQWVIERTPELVSTVLEGLPLPEGTDLRVILGDAREALTLLPADVAGAIDVLVDDIYSGGAVAAELRPMEYLRALGSLLSSAGVLLVNIPIGPDLSAPRSRTADVLDVFPFVTLFGEASSLEPGTDGNLVLVASPQPFSRVQRSLLVSAGPHPAVLLDGDELSRWAGRHGP